MFASGLLALASVGCAAGSTAGTTDRTAVPTDLGEVADLVGKPEVSIDVIDNSFTPKAFKVVPGTRITFVNTGVNVHNVTPVESGDFTALNLLPGASGVVIAPQTTQTFAFYCTLHGGAASGQRGAFVVVRPA